jgi:hypothetical protein
MAISERSIQSKTKPETDLTEHSARVVHAWVQSFFRKLYERVFAGRTFEEVIEQILTKGAGQQIGRSGADLREEISKDRRCYWQFCRSLRLCLTENALHELTHGTHALQEAKIPKLHRQALAKALLDVLATRLWMGVSEQEIFDSLPLLGFLGLFSEKSYELRAPGSEYPHQNYKIFAMDLEEKIKKENISYYSALKKLSLKKEVRIYPFTGAQLLDACDKDSLRYFSQKQDWPVSRLEYVRATLLEMARE